MIWKTIEEYPNYAVSDEGSVKRIATSRILKPCEDVDGYLTISLSKRTEGSIIIRTVRIHKLVAEAFLGNRVAGMQVNHIDGCKNNNASSNLEYLTGKENHAHATRLGLKARGIRNCNAKLTEEKVIDIRKLYETGNYSFSGIAERYSLNKTTVHRAVTGKSWRHV